MAERKQTGKKLGIYVVGLCIVNVEPKCTGWSLRKKHEYQYFYCSKKCGAPVVHMEKVDTASINYLRDLLSPENQDKIANALRRYPDGENDRVKDF